MAVIAPSSIAGPLVRATVEATLTASDTFTYLPNTGQILRLRNVTAGALTVNLLGNAAASQTYGEGGVVNYAAGYSTGSIPLTTGDVQIPLDSIKGFLAGGTVTVTGGTGIRACLQNPT